MRARLPCSDTILPYLRLVLLRWLPCSARQAQGDGLRLNLSDAP